MLHKISTAIKARMQYLEELDVKEHNGDIKHQNSKDRLRQVPPETGKLLAILAASCSVQGQFLEIGTSAGYSTLWLSLAMRQLQAKLITFELDQRKINLARETFSTAAIDPYVQLIEGDVLEHLSNYQDISFCFLDTEKFLYSKCYEILIPNLLSGGIIVADNVISHQQELQATIEKIMQDERLDSVIVPVGQGVLLSRKV